MTLPPITGIAETALYVSNLSASRDFYTRLFGFPQILEEEGRLIALGVARRQVLLLFERAASTHPTIASGGTIPPHDGHGTLHMAFAIDAAQLEPWRVTLRAQGIPIESEVDCPTGGHSIYFRDPDQHLVELISPGCWTVDTLTDAAALPKRDLL